jgi:hypothetical protein
MGQIRGNIYFLKPDQRANGYVGARSKSVQTIDGQHQTEDRLVGGQIREIVYCLKPDQRVRSFTRGRSEGILVCLGPDQREDILPEARSERIKVHRGQIRGNIYFLKPDQRV